MANASAVGTARAEQPADPTWHELATVTDAKRRLWRGSRNRTSWTPCGRDWDTVAVQPMAAGLDALTAMRAGTRCGHQVLADHLRDRLYVAVPTDSAGTFANILGVRVLSSTHQLLVPSTPRDGSIAADWVSHPPRGTPPVLIAARFADHLRALISPCVGEDAHARNGHTVLYGPEGRPGAELPPDRATHELVVRAVLSWSEPAALRPDDYEQVGLLLSGAACAVAAAVREHAGRLPDDDGRRLFAEIVLAEADGRLSQRSRNLHGVRNKARMLRALYERLDRLKEARPAVRTAMACPGD
ncbi:hypothetical protein ACIOKD_32890 [Streptomyces sp. NPDC087844]|uniref:hypothetical protein n=1 Tax=Streptomyces sp. NPDC087844 TaxID=3365805 RepID=UPI0037F3B74A